MLANFELARIWARNLYKHRVQRSRLLEPMGVTWHATNRCNLRCSFCDDGRGNRYPDLAHAAMSTDEVKHVLTLVRKKVPVLYITGGEPLVRRDLAHLVHWAKREAGYRYIGLVTNGLLLARQESLLDDIDDLAISMHTLDGPRGDRIYKTGSATAGAIKDAVLKYSALGRERGYRFNVSCVVMPEQIDDAHSVLDFCLHHRVPFTVMPQSVTPYPHPQLRGNAAYVALIERAIDLKKQGRAITGSRAYFEHIRDFSNFSCFPTTVPRIYPNGDLVYPCTPMNKVAGNLVGATSFDEVLAQGIAKHGGVPACDARCFAQCFIEISNVIEYPVALMKEHLRLMVRWHR